MGREFSPHHRAPPGGEYYVFRDATHNLIEIEDALDGQYIRSLLRNAEVQRLRHIRQNGFSFLVYPSLEVSRFPHALGAFHIAKGLTQSLSERQPSEAEGFPKSSLGLNDRDCLAFSVAALLHDIGHGPLSHVWEECWAEPRGLRHFHEDMGHKILMDQNTGVGKFLSAANSHPRYPNIGRDILAFYAKTHRLSYLLPLLAGNLDVDRMDFMARDTRSAGVTYGFHDLEWIVRSLRFARLPARYTREENARWIIAIDGRKGLSTLVQFLQARENMYKLVYHHKTTRSATRMLALLFKRAAQLGSHLHCSSAILRQSLISNNVDVSTFARLDDSTLWSALGEWSHDESADQIVRDLSRQLLSRDLFKAFLLSEHTYRRLREIDSEDYGHTLAKLVCARMNCRMEDAQYYYAFDNTAFDVVGRPSKSPSQDVWIMQSVALGFEYKTLRNYWETEIRAPIKHEQHLLLVHRDVVSDLETIITRLSFPAASAADVDEIPEAPPPYRVLTPLGKEGAWKVVYAGALCTPGADVENIVALKQYKSAQGDTLAIDRDVSAINLLAQDHPNLSRPKLLYHEKGETWILETLWTSSLEELVKKHGPRRNVLEIFDMGRQLFSGLSAMHRSDLRHTDIKPDNCGVIHSPRDGYKYVLGDFGCISSKPMKFPGDVRLLGTLRTRSPEVILQERISLASDVWALGATIYALCAGAYPFMEFDAPHNEPEDRKRREDGIKSNVSRLIAEHRQRLADNLPPCLSELLQKCFEDDAKRPSAQTICQAFEVKYNELRDKDPRCSTAWQQAEDALYMLRAGDLGGDRMSVFEDIRKLIHAFPDYISPALKVALSQRVDGVVD